MKFNFKYYNAQNSLDYYDQVKLLRETTIREYIRNTTLDVFSFQLYLEPFWGYFKKPRIQFLYFHHVFDDEIKKFDRLVQDLLKIYTFISYSEAVNKIISGEIDKPYVCFSSDDGFKNNLNAHCVLKNYGISCCFFINPDSIGLKSIDKIKDYCEKRLFFPPVNFLNWDDVENLKKNGHEIGSHTIGHINIAEVGLNYLEDNLFESRENIINRLGSVSHFAFPFGELKHFSRPAFDLVFRVGFNSCASAVRGCHVPSKENIDRTGLLVRRDLVIFDWSQSHVLYFNMRNSRNSYFQDNLLNYL